MGIPITDPRGGRGRPFQNGFSNTPGVGGVARSKLNTT